MDKANELSDAEARQLVALMDRLDNYRLSLVMAYAVQRIIDQRHDNSLLEARLAKK